MLYKYYETGFQKSTYSINCDYGGAFIKVRESSEYKSFENISDKLIALVIYLGSLKTKIVVINLVVIKLKILTMFMMPS